MDKSTVKFGVVDDTGISNEIWIEDNCILSNLHEPGEDNDLYNAAIDGIESLILALHCAGIDIETKGFAEATETAVNACSQNL